MPPTSAKTPAEKAVADVEKAYRDFEKANEKVLAAQEKLNALTEARTRADKTLIWTGSHPDLPDDFDLDAFVEGLKQPFDGSEGDESVNASDEAGDGVEIDVAVLEQDQGDGEQPPNELGPQAGDDVLSDAELAEQIAIQADDVDPFGDDDPFGDEPEPAPAPKGRGTRRR